MDDAAAPIDPLARAGALAIAAGRIGIGIGAFGFARPALGALGFERPDQITIALARLAGSRDIALGAHALASAGDRERLREATVLGALVDTGDAIAFGALLGAGPGLRATGLKNAPLGLAAAAVGVWIYSRL